VVREAVEAGIEQIILVTHSSKASIENYFDRNFELETTLEQKKKFELINTRITENVNILMELNRQLDLILDQLFETNKDDSGMGLAVKIADLADIITQIQQL
jgi:UTP-glucose-1-phosphate uridylyltransferase